LFSSVLGYTLAKLTDQGRPVLEFVESLNLAMQKLVGYVTWISPIGVFSLVSYNLGTTGDFWSAIQGLLLLIAARFTGIIVHGLITLPLIYFILTRKNPVVVLSQMSQAWIVAFATSSSAATLPVTLKSVEENLGVPPIIARFVCTAGATINMDAAAIAYSITAVTIGNALGMQLNFVDMIMVVFASTLVSVGAAALPSAGLINYMAVMNAVGIPLERAVPILAPILSIDWLEDKLMTIVNIEGDVFGAVTVFHFGPNAERENKD